MLIGGVHQKLHLMRMVKMLPRTLFTKEGTAVKHKSFEVLRRHDVKEQTGCMSFFMAFLPNDHI